MNKARRAQIERALGMLEEALALLEPARDEEQEGFENLSEWLQQAERGQEMEAAAEALYSATSAVEDAIEQCNAAVDG